MDTTFSHDAFIFVLGLFSSLCTHK